MRMCLICSQNICNLSADFWSVQLMIWLAKLAAKSILWDNMFVRLQYMRFVYQKVWFADTKPTSTFELFVQQNGAPKTKDRSTSSVAVIMIIIMRCAKKLPAITALVSVTIRDEWGGGIGAAREVKGLKMSAVSVSFVVAVIKFIFWPTFLDRAI